MFFFQMLRAIVTDWGLDGINVLFSVCHLPTGVGISPPSPFEHSRCFYSDTEGADGAADVLEVLRNSPLEKLDFDLCSQIPSAAWQRVSSGAWPALRDAPGIPEEELSRIVSGGAADGSFCRGRLVFASDSGDK